MRQISFQLNFLLKIAEQSEAQSAFSLQNLNLRYILKFQEDNLLVALLSKVDMKIFRNSTSFEKSKYSTPAVRRIVQCSDDKIGIEKCENGGYQREDEPQYLNSLKIMKF